MDALSVLRALARRWWLAVPLLVLTVVGTALTYLRAETFYTASVTATLQTAIDDDGQEGPEPVSGQVLTAVLESDEIRAEVRDGHEDVEYRVNTGTDPAGTLLRVVATAPTADGIIPVIERLLSRIEIEVREREDATGTDPSDRATVQHLAVPLTVEEGLPADDPAASVADDEPRFHAESVSLVSAPTPPTSPFPASVATVRYLEELMGSPEVLRALQPVPTTEVTLTWDRRDSVPIFYLTAVAATPQQAVEARDAAYDTAANLLRELQLSAGIRNRLTVMSPLSEPGDATPATSRVNRAVVGVLGLGVIATASLTVVLDGWLINRRRRRPDDGASHVDRPSGDLAPWIPSEGVDTHRHPGPRQASRRVGGPSTWPPPMSRTRSLQGSAAASNGRRIPSDRKPG